MSEDQIIDVPATEVAPVEEPKAESPEISPEAAMKVLQAKGQENLALCKEDIAKALEKYGFSLEIQHTIQIVPKQ